HLQFLLLLSHVLQVLFKFQFLLYHFCLFFFSSRRRHTISKRDWSSDVCSSDLTIYLSPNSTLLISPLGHSFKRNIPKIGFFIILNWSDRNPIILAFQSFLTSVNLAPPTVYFLLYCIIIFT